MKCSPRVRRGNTNETTAVWHKPSISLLGLTFCAADTLWAWFSPLCFTVMGWKSEPRIFHRSCRWSDTWSRSQTYCWRIGQYAHTVHVRGINYVPPTSMPRELLKGAIRFCSHTGLLQKSVFLRLKGREKSGEEMLGKNKLINTTE